MSEIGPSERDSVSPDILRDYYRLAGRRALLDAATEVQLAKQIEAGLLAREKINDLQTDDDFLSSELYRELRQLEYEGQQAYTHMTEANLRLVINTAKKVNNYHMPIIDIIQEGNIGLMKAIERFDYTKGFKFSTYATTWIRQSISKAIADKSRIVRIPVKVFNEMHKMTKLENSLTIELGREPSIDELAEEMNVPAKKVADMKRHGQAIASLNLPIGDKDGDELGDLITDDAAVGLDDGVTAKAMERDIQDLLARLDMIDPRLGYIIRRRKGFDGTVVSLDEVSLEMGIGRERVWQLEQKALHLLRGMPGVKEQLSDYL